MKIRNRNRRTNKIGLPTKNTGMVISVLSLCVALSSVASNVIITVISNDHATRLEYSKLTYETKFRAYLKYQTALDGIFDAQDMAELDFHCENLSSACRELSVFVDDKTEKDMSRFVNNFLSKRQPYLEKFQGLPYEDANTYLGRSLMIGDLVNQRDKIKRILFDG